MYAKFYVAEARINSYGVRLLCNMKLSPKQKKRKFDFFQACRESVYCLDFARIPCYKLILRLKLIASD